MVREILVRIGKDQKDFPLVREARVTKDFPSETPVRKQAKDFPVVDHNWMKEHGLTDADFPRD